MKEYIISIDQGTTATKVALFSLDGELKAVSTQPVRQIYPVEGWVEHDPFDLLDTIKKGISDVIADSGVKPEQILAMGIDNQGETIIAFDRKTGEPLYNAIVWQDRRTSSFCSQLKKELDENLINEKTGLFLDPYFSAPKMHWLISNVARVKDALKKGSAVIATSDVWLLFMLTGKKTLLTDVTTASRTLLFNINSLKWDDELLSMFEIPPDALPEVVPSSYTFGQSDPGICGGISSPINASVVDQQAALFGHACFYRGDAKITYGTGGFMLLNTGRERVWLNDRLSTTIAAQFDNDICYAIDGGVYCVASCINWLIKELKIVLSPEELGKIDFDNLKNSNTYFVPSMAGISAPYWKPEVNGAFLGLSLCTKGEELVRAMLESIAYRFLEITEIIRNNGFTEISAISVDGGVSKNDFLMQFQADLLGVEIKRPKIKETTSLGCFYLAGLKSGVWSDVSILKKNKEDEKIFLPEKDNSKKLERYRIWQNAVKSVLSWHDSY